MTPSPAPAATATAEVPARHDPPAGEPARPPLLAPAPAPSPNRLSSRLAKVVHLAAALRTCVHVRYRLANAIARPLPDFAAGYVLSRLYRAAGFDGVDRGAFISAPLQLTGTVPTFHQNLRIAANVLVSTDVTINLDAVVSIGEGCTISPFVRIYTATHRHGPSEQRCMPEVRARPVVIEDGCWIGLGAMITPGVVVGRGSVVSAGAVLSRNVPPNSFVTGNPATVAGRLQEGADWIGPRPIRSSAAAPRRAGGAPSRSGADR